MRVFLVLPLFLVLASRGRPSSLPRWEPLHEPGNGGWTVSIEVSPFDSQRMLIGGDVLAAALTTDGGRNWEPALGFQNWEMGDFTFHPTDPNIVWAGTLGGPYESTDGGRTWTLKRNGFPPLAAGNSPSAPIQKVIFDPNHPDILLALGGNHRQLVGSREDSRLGAIWRSTDGGEHWTWLTTIGADGSGPADRHGVNLMTGAFAAGSSRVVYVCSDHGGVYRSDDGGRSFAKANQGLPNSEAWFIALHPTDPNILWVALGQGGKIYKSTDGAATWKSSSVGLDDIGPEQDCGTIVVCPGDPRVLYTHGCSWRVPFPTYRSSDGGATWTEIIKSRDASTIVGGTAYPGTPIVKWMSVDPRDPNHVLALTEAGYAIQSRDGGATWRDITSHRAGKGWRGNGYSGQCTTRVKWNPFCPHQLFTVGCDSGKLLRSDDAAWSWTAEASPLDPYNGARDVTYARDGTIYLGTGQRRNEPGESIGKSTDGGRTWAYVSRPAGASGTNEGVYVLPDNSRSVWAIIGDQFYHSADGGATWRIIPLANPGPLYGLEPDPKNPLTMYVAAENGIFRSTDGIDFALMPGSPGSMDSDHLTEGPVNTGMIPGFTHWNSVTIDPANPAVIYAVAYNHRGQGVWRYDGRWTRIFDKRMAYRVAVDPANSKRLAVITEDWPHDICRADGIWLSEDGGAHWTQSIDGLGTRRCTTIAFNPDKSAQLIVGTDGNGFYTTDWGTSAPFGGTPRCVMATIQAEDYDVGGPDSAFGVATAQRAGGSDYRPDAVDIHAGGSGHVLSNLAKGDWFKYRVIVPATGYYDLTLRAASATVGGSFHFVANGVNVTGPINIPETKHAGTWTDVIHRGLRLNAGEQYLTLHVEAPGADLDYFRLTPGAAPVTE